MRKTQFSTIFHKFTAVVILATVVHSAVSATANGEEGLTEAQKAELGAYFGFGPLEVFKIDHGISQLRVADFNEDGLNDIVVANNQKSTIEVLIQRNEKPDKLEQPKDVNDLVNHWRFEKKSTSIMWAVQTMKAAEVTGDEHIDLIFFGDPAELVVLPGRGDGTFGDALTERVRDGLAISAGLDIGDLNGDGRLDIALLADTDIVMFPQPEEGGLGNPVRFAHAAESPGAIKLADADGDGRCDLLLITDDAEYPLLVRFQDEFGNLGPVHRMKLPPLRSGKIESCLGRKQADLFGVERSSGRLKRWVFDVSGKGDQSREWAVEYYPLPGKSRPKELPMVLGDVNGDGEMDIVTADVDAAQMVLFPQKKNVGLLPPETFGGQVQMKAMAAADVDGDGKSEVFVMSTEEGLIAQTQYEEKRLRFPKPVPTMGKPYALDVARFEKLDKFLVGYVYRDDDSAYHLAIQPVDAESTEATKSFKIEGLDEPPAALRLVDVNRDGRRDALVFNNYAPITVMLQDEVGGFTVLDKDASQSGLVKDAKIESFDFADTDGDGAKEVLLAQKQFVRALFINDKNAWEILDQYNAPGSDAELIGVTTLQMPDSKRPWLAMYDRRAREVHFFSPGEGGTFSLDRSTRVGPFDLKAMAAAPLSGGEQDSLMLADASRIALIVPRATAARMEEVGTYESSVKDGILANIAIGDLNHDGRTDLAAIEWKDNFIEIITFGPDESMVLGNRFRVFAKKQFSGGFANDRAEPRWIEIADVTNDGHDDIILIAHDRILLYPGE